MADWILLYGLVGAIQDCEGFWALYLACYASRPFPNGAGLDEHQAGHDHPRHVGAPVNQLEIPTH